MSNPFLDRANRQKTQSRAYWGSKKQEKGITKQLAGAREVARSGAGTTKGDVRVHKIARIEAKLTSADSFRVTKEMLEKINNAALCSDEIPVIIVGFLKPGATQPSPQDQVIILPLSALQLLQSVAIDAPDKP
jgi:hypothetical protein